MGSESEFSVAEVHNWLRSYNLKNVIHLTFAEELPNALFVVELESSNLSKTKASLLAASPLGSANMFASVNNYTLTFSPCSQVDFQHLVTVNIANGSSELFGIIRFFTVGIGSYVKGVLGANSTTSICLWS